MIDIKISTSDGLTKYSRRLRNIAQVPANMKPIWEDIRYALIDEWVETIESEGNGKWPELREATVKARGSEHPIGVRTGEGLSGVKFKGDPLNICNIQNKSAEFGFKGQLAILHWGKYNQWARKIIDITQATKKKINDVLKQHLKEAKNK